MLIINFEGREVKGLSKGRYDETFAGEDAEDAEDAELGSAVEVLYSIPSQSHTIFSI